MKTSRLTAQPQGLPVPIETALLASEARMAAANVRRDGTGSPGTARVI